MAHKTWTYTLQSCVLFSDLVGKNINKDHFCTICPLAKQTRVSFSRSSIKSSNFFQLLHLDILGSLMFQIKLKYSMFIIVVDDYTRVIWFSIVHKKSEFSSFFKQFHAYVQTHYNKQIKTLMMLQNSLKGKSHNFTYKREYWLKQVLKRLHNKMVFWEKTYTTRKQGIL